MDKKKFEVSSDWYDAPMTYEDFGTKLLPYKLGGVINVTEEDYIFSTVPQMEEGSTIMTICTVRKKKGTIIGDIPNFPPNNNE